MNDQMNENLTGRFFESLYRNCRSGTINLRFLPSGKNQFIPLQSLGSIPRIVEENSGQNAHFGVATRKEGDGTKDGIIQIPCLWIDLDFGASTEEDNNEKLMKVFFEFPLEPTFIVLSGGGVHVYWRLKEPLNHEDIPEAESYLKRLASYLGGDMAATDASRLLRIPNSLNYKYNPERLVEVWKASESEYSLSDFDFLPRSDCIPVIPDVRTPHAPGWEKELLEGVNEGERNISITRLAGRYLSKGLSREEILPILLDANERFIPPLLKDEIETTLDSIIRTHIRNAPVQAEVKEEDGKGVNLHLTTLNDVFQYPEPNYLIEPLIVEGTVSILGAYSGVGKSILSLSIMKSILTGDPLWGRYRVNKTGPVLLVDEETPQGFLRERTTKMGFTPDLPFYFLHFQDVRLDQETVYQALLPRIEEVKPTLIVVDSLVRVHRQREDDAISMASVVAKLRKIANSGTTVLVIHHHKKGDGPLNQKLRGSTDIVAGIDLEYALLTRDNHLVFTSVKTRTQPIVPIKLQMEANNNHIALIYRGEEMGEEGEVVTEIIELLDECGEAGVEEIFRDLKDRGIKIGINKLREVLRKANGKDLIEKIGLKGKMIYALNQAG